MKIQWLGLNAQESPGRLRVCVRVCSGSLNVGGVDGSIRVLWSVPPGQEPYRQSARTTHFTFGWHAFSLSEKAESGVAGMEQEPAHVCVCVSMQVLTWLLECVCKCVCVWVCVCECVCMCWSEGGGRSTFGRCCSLGCMCISGLMFMWIID